MVAAVRSIVNVMPLTMMHTEHRAAGSALLTSQGGTEAERRPLSTLAAIEHPICCTIAV